MIGGGDETFGSSFINVVAPSTDSAHEYVQRDSRIQLIYGTDSFWDGCVYGRFIHLYDPVFYERPDEEDSEGLVVWDKRSTYLGSSGKT
ncbi:Hypothetical protein FKW44_007585 [Caligus rogercresseyi]|uniref:Uncharacterized protein n=1 Tax=Caligus rogercresseyi TaxID=217165 RepID=A0A7T8KEX8_CALRO|nr:Hypothetical protein FKW44_007585 [Caligus rogercresseyi]